MHSSQAREILLVPFQTLTLSRVDIVLELVDLQGHSILAKPKEKRITAGNLEMPSLSIWCFSIYMYQHVASKGGKQGL